MSRKESITIEGEHLEVSNLGKVFYPKTGFTKGQVIDYYIRISRWLLPYLKDRPIILKRYPNGVEGFFFYERNCPAHRPEWIQTKKVAGSSGDTIDYCVINGLPALVWAANLADLELHTFLHIARAPKRPQSLAFDLDPGSPATILHCGKVALLVKKLFDRLGLKSFVKTSGSKGLQVYVPLHTPVTYEKTKAFAHAVALLLEQEHPDLVVSRMQKHLRKGKVLIDWSQNEDHKTTVSVYSLRARERPTVSTPVTWAEVSAAVRKKDPDSLVFEADETVRRVEKKGDLFLPVLKLRQKLPPFKALGETEG
jgi:bifunctional non-homologous end joining protein LigD